MELKESTIEALIIEARDDAIMLSWLWDHGLMPEQIEKGSPEYHQMAGILYRHFRENEFTSMDSHI